MGGTLIRAEENPGSGGQEDRRAKWRTVKKNEKRKTGTGVNERAEGGNGKRGREKERVREAGKRREITELVAETSYERRIRGWQYLFAWQRKRCPFFFLWLL